MYTCAHVTQNNQERNRTRQEGGVGVEATDSRDGWRQHERRIMARCTTSHHITIIHRMCLHVAAHDQSLKLESPHEADSRR